MKCRECEELMVEVLYGESDESTNRRFDEHVRACPDCRRLLAEIRSTLGAMDGRERRDPGQAYWDGYWNRLSSRMEREESERRGRGWLGRLLPSLSPAALSWAQRGALAVLLVVFGAVVGRMVLPGGAPVENSGDSRQEGRPGPVVRQATAEDCARQYIEDTQVLLLALVNSDPEAGGEVVSDWSAEKQRSRELVAQAASLKADLKDPKQRRLRDLVGELELIMMQIANLETAGDLESVELIRSSVNDRDVMLKINLEKMRGADRPEPVRGECDA
ncbi:MAG: zf-HC2 domain-containing protein [Candidatus Latescibacterota bacterium]|jgi:hypothetical protein